MRRLGLMVGGGGAALAAFLLLVGPVNWSASGDPTGSPSATPTTSSSPSPTDTASATPTAEPTEDTCEPNRAARDFLYEEGFEKSDFVLGEDMVDWSKVTKSHVDHAFTWPLHTQTALLDFLDSDSASAAAARGLIGDDMVVAGDEWVAVQFMVPVRYTGNHSWDGQKAIEEGAKLVPAGDVWWLNVSSDCTTVEPSDSVRAACGNVGLDTIQPVATRD